MMKRILVTGGTVFVSRFVARYFTDRGNEVYVLNRGTRPQEPGVTLLRGDRNDLGDLLKGYYFDAVLDVTAYTRQDVENLLKGLGWFGDYILVSSSAVYPETNPQPFSEVQTCGPNGLWGAYGIHKLEAENYLQEQVPGAYILRPPYLYGPMESIYREPFVFECAEARRKFFIPGEGNMKLQFFHVEDLCRFMEILLQQHPAQQVYNVGNPDPVSISDWVKLCYDVVGASLETVSVQGHPQRNYFCFHDYEYMLDVSAQMTLLGSVKPLEMGLRESWEWFRENRQAVLRRPYQAYIDSNL